MALKSRVAGAEASAFTGAASCDDPCSLPARLLPRTQALVADADESDVVVAARSQALVALPAIFVSARDEPQGGHPPGVFGVHGGIFPPRVRSGRHGLKNCLVLVVAGGDR